MTGWQIITWIFQILLFVCLGALQFFDPPVPNQEPGVKKEFFSFVHSNRLVISFILGTGFALFSGWTDLLRPRRMAGEIRQAIMEAMLEELFANDKINVRITIFKDANFRKRVVIYFRELKKNWRNCFTFRKQYVQAWERLGKSRSYSYFRYDSQNEKNCQGIVGIVRYREEEVLVTNLADIDNINLNDPRLLNKKTTLYKTVYGYMKDGYLGDDIETLKRLRRKTRHLYGNIISDYKGEYKGVLMIDSFSGVSPFNQSVLDNLQYYLKLIAATL